MGFQCGIVGLPNVGKSTLFNALTASAVPAENYPFCTVDPNVGVVAVPDDRLPRVAKEFNPKKVTATTIEFLDIAGLVKGASQGEGLGNQFLSHIGTVDAIAQVVRCFDDDQVSHVSGKVDPVGDIEVINAELLLKDMETVRRRMESVSRAAKSGDKKLKAELGFLEKLQAQLDMGKPLRGMRFNEQEVEFLREIALLTTKRVLYVANIAEDEVLEGEPSEATKQVFAYAEQEGAEAVALCSRLEADLAVLEGDEQATFMEEFGIEELGLPRLIHAGYELLDLVTFFSGNQNEVRAWTVPKGTLAPQAAGVIHTDFEAGFTNAEVFSCEDLAAHGSIRELREHGLVHIHGRDYEVQDGDVMQFKFKA